MTREEIQKIINEYYKKGGDYNSAAQKYAEEKYSGNIAGGIKEWNRLVNERDRLAHSPAKTKNKAVSEGKKLSQPKVQQKVDLYYPRSTDPQPKQAKKPTQAKPVTTAVKQKPLASKSTQIKTTAKTKVAAVQKPAVVAKTQPKPVATKSNKVSTANKPVAKKPATKQAPKKKSASILSRAMSLLNNFSEDFFAGLDAIGAGKIEDVIVRNKENKMQRQAQTLPKWDDRRFNEFMTGDSSSIKKEYRDHIKSRANMDSKIAYIDKGDAKHGDERAVIWDDATQQVKTFNTGGVSAPAYVDPSAKDIGYLKKNWVSEQGNLSGGVSGTYRGLLGQYSWANPSSRANVTDTDKSNAQEYMDRLNSMGIKNPQYGVQFWNEGGGNDPLQVSWGNMVPEGYLLPNQLHASSCEGGTPGCTRFGPGEWDEVLRLMMSKKNRYISTYDNMFTRR